MFRALIVLTLASHVFFMYGSARTMRETFGFDVATTGIALVFAMFLLLPFVWAVAIADLPLILSRHRERKRYQRGQCAACGYELRQSPSVVCSECGEPRREWPAYVMTWGTVRRYLLLNAAALVLGVASSEAWLLLDEHRFQTEVHTLGIDGPNAIGSHVRGRAAPFGNAAMIYRSGEGYFATD